MVTGGTGVIGFSNSDQQPALNSRRLYITWPQRDTKQHKREILYHQAAILCSANYSYNTNEMPNHFHFCCERCDLLRNYSNGDLFICEDNILYVFSRVI